MLGITNGRKNGIIDMNRSDPPRAWRKPKRIITEYPRHSACERVLFIMSHHHIINIEYGASLLCTDEVGSRSREIEHECDKCVLPNCSVPFRLSVIEYLCGIIRVVQDTYRIETTLLNILSLEISISNFFLRSVYNNCLRLCRFVSFIYY